MSYIKEFGLKLYILENVRKVLRKIPGDLSIAKPFINYVDRTVQNKLELEFSDIILKYSDCEVPECNDDESNIWTFWWQGEERMPDIVKLCISSMRKNGKNVHVFSADKLKEYIEIPQYITDKFNDGSISLAHLSDIVRMKVLRKNGGWLDATIFVSTAISPEVFQLSYYTGKLQEKFNKYCVSHYRWNGSVLTGVHNFPFFSFADDCFMRYWSSHEVIIDYFLIDYVTAIAFEHFDWFKNAYNMVPQNNKDIFQLKEKLNEEFDAAKYKDLTDETCFFKLNWKMKCEEGNTYFNQLKKEYHL
ncbi:MAG: capsular polysaccharide synthesis protein [Ruminococcus sp.]|nr:capsular polysaccharide synthesis protein [Ruminococcus sp.]